ncbi:protein rhsB domain protein [Escherichia coli STEC_O31]|nr:protein rhsB domain protein [Escherichia coli STEC_O31]
MWLTHDPEYPENLPAAPLVRYGWTPRGELAVVYDRSGKQVRSFTYDDKYRGRMVAHRHTGRPESVTVTTATGGDRTAKPGRLKLHVSV